jgi:hypothetical protein
MSLLDPWRQSRMKLRFTPFLRLPIELQLHVWDYFVASDTRIVEVRWASEQGFTFHSSPPAPLSVCHTSRQYTQSRYLTSVLKRFDISKPNKSPQTLFDFERDILYFPYPSSCPISHRRSLAWFLRGLDVKDTEALRNLAFTIPVCNQHHKSSHGTIGRTIGDIFRQIQVIARRSCRLHLKTLVLVLGDPGGRSNFYEGVQGFTKIKLEDQYLEVFQRFCDFWLMEPVCLNAGGPTPRQYSDSWSWGHPQIELGRADRIYENGDIMGN